MANRKRPGSRLLKVWAVISVLYVGVAGALSVHPIRSAIAEAGQPAAAIPAPRLDTRGPLPEAPDTPAMKLGKTVARQAAITLAPPLLALWFGWDLWFALTGFLSRGHEPSKE
ncbi:MAG TPA: hypothetical protein VIE16_05515 [Phenylobacterium sp.]|jgi:hypothetical protein